MIRRNMEDKNFDEVCEAQGWNDRTVVWLLREFIARERLSDQLDSFARRAAADENHAGGLSGKKCLS